MNSRAKKWEHFERLVAAIHLAADAGAEVRWDETIDGRQFDVTIHFRKGLYDYLTVIECKDQERPVSVEKVDAFVTKAADVHANHAVIASSSGFQQGAQEVDNRHNVTLILVREASKIDLSVFGAAWGNPLDAMHIQEIELKYSNGQLKQLPIEAHAMRYYVEHIFLMCSSGKLSLDSLVRRHSAHFAIGGADEYSDNLITCSPGTEVIGPDDGEFPLKPLSAIRIRAGMTKALKITGPVEFEPYLLIPDVAVRNVSTGEETTFSQHGLAMGAGTEFEIGGFYEQPQLASYYYCARISGDLADIYLIESFQLGRLIQAALKVRLKFANHYVPVTQESLIERLRRRLASFEAKRAKDSRGR